MSGSNVEDTFSLSSEGYPDENGSLQGGVIGVMGISSDKSEAVVEVLAGVLSAETEERFGVTGKSRTGTGDQRLPPR